jgi:CHAT domain-containing protein
LILLVVSSAARARADPDDLADCAARFAAAPAAEESSECFLKVAEGDPEQWPGAVSRVRALLGRHPRHPWLTFYLGSLYWGKDPRRAEELYRTAADLFAERKDPLAEVRARSNLYRQLQSQDRDREAAAEVRRAVRVAEASGAPLVLARARILEATLLSDRNEDLPRALRLLLQAEEILFPRGPYRMQRDCLLLLGNTAIDLNHLPEARRRFEQLGALTAAEHDAFGEAAARYGLLRVLRDELAETPRPGGREEALTLARQALAAAEAAGERRAETLSHAILGLLTHGPEARLHFERCFETAEELENKSFCRSTLARGLTSVDPRAALAVADEALELAQKADDPWAIAYSWRERMRVSWRLGPPEQAVKGSLAALDAIEVLRDRQPGVEGRAGLFSVWARHYHWLAGRLLLQHRTGHSESDLELAFRVQERMRARALIDALETARAAPPPAAATRDLQSRRAAVLAEISRVQRRLLDRNLARRSDVLVELRRLERTEEELRDQITCADPAFSALRRPDFATPEQVRQALAEDEALLSFQIAPWQDMMGVFAGGAWLIVVTRQGTAVHPLRHRLANRTDLRPAVETFSGLFETGGDDGDASAALYQALLADGLEGLGPGVRRLVVVPDDALYRLPFAALRPAPGAAPLASRYEITLAPSATLWLRWHEGRLAGDQTAALVLADPVTPATVKLAAKERTAALVAPPELGALPWARREGEAIVDHLGGGSELLVGEEASEDYLKRNGASRFGILHFATHAWTDDVEPDRSFVLLAPGNLQEDGLLQIREIAGLDLRGRTVVLSSCSSASGEILRGEGVMGLARAFFQAGAHTVVASLWPLRDDYGAALFDRFYRHLAAGKSVAAALQSAQLDRLDEGAPPVAWAGVVVLGDGDRVPLPGGRRGLGPAAKGALALLALAGFAALGLLARRPQRI